ncbi:hypothetical protein [Teichococcus aestuarii]
MDDQTLALLIFATAAASGFVATMQEGTLRLVWAMIALMQVVTALAWML